MRKLFALLLLVASACVPELASAQIKLTGLPRTTSTTGLNDSALTLITDSATVSKAATIAQFRKALSIKNFDSLLVTNRAAALNFQLNAVGGGLAGSVRYIDGGATSTYWQVNSPTAGGAAFSVNNVNQMTIQSTGMTVIPLITANGGLNINGGSLAANTLYLSAGNGLSVAAGTGSSFDFTLLTSGGSGILTVPTGTANVRIPNGSLTANTALNFGTLIASSTALSTPAAQTSTQFIGFASTALGAAIMGYGTTYDVSLVNRAGNVALGVGPNNTGLTMTGTLGSTTNIGASTYSATQEVLFANTVNGGVLQGFGSTYDASMMNRSGTTVIGVVAGSSNAQINGSLTQTGNLILSGSGLGINNGTTTYMSAVSGANPAVTFGSTGAYTFTGQLIGKGTATNDHAAAGNIGEDSARTTALNTTALSSPNAKSIDSLNLTAGDWEVHGVCSFTPTVSTSITLMQCGTNTSTNAIGAIGSYSSQSLAANIPGTTTEEVMVAPTFRYSFTTQTKVYLVAKATFSVSTLNAGDGFYARRIR